MQQLNQSHANNIGIAVRDATRSHLEQQPKSLATNVYQTVMAVAESHLIDVVLHEYHGNQSKAATALGLNRATLRTKLKRHGLL